MEERNELIGIINESVHKFTEMKPACQVLSFFLPEKGFVWQNVLIFANSSAGDGGGGGGGGTSIIDNKKGVEGFLSLLRLAVCSQRMGVRQAKLRACLQESKTSDAICTFACSLACLSASQPATQFACRLPGRSLVCVPGGLLSPFASQPASGPVGRRADQHFRVEFLRILLPPCCKSTSIHPRTQRSEKASNLPTKYKITENKSEERFSDGSSSFGKYRENPTRKELLSRCVPAAMSSYSQPHNQEN